MPKSKRIFSKKSLSTLSSLLELFFLSVFVGNFKKSIEGNLNLIPFFSLLLLFYINYFEYLEISFINAFLHACFGIGIKGFPICSIHATENFSAS